MGLALRFASGFVFAALASATALMAAGEALLALCDR